MKVVQVPRRFVLEAWGGTETVIAETASRLPDLGWDTGVVCPAALSVPGPDSVASLSVWRVPYFYPYLGLSAQAKERMDQVGGNLFSFSLFWKLLRLPGLQLIHLHTGKRVGGIARTVARARGIPYLISLHGGALEVPRDEAAHYTEPTRRALEWGKALGYLVGSRRVLEDAAAIICVSPGEQDILRRKFPAKNVAFLPNGVSPDNFAEGKGPRFREAWNIPQNRLLLLTVGRIDPQKNQKLAIMVLRDLLAHGLDCHLALVGPVTDQNYLAVLEVLAEQPQTKGRVSIIAGLAPASNELADAYQAADLFFMPSRHEPFGIVVLEAWAAGKPVVAARVGGMAHLIEHQRTGLFFEPGHGGAASDACLRILSNQTMAGELAKAGKRQALQKYSWERVTAKLAKIYQEVLNAHSVRK